MGGGLSLGIDVVKSDKRSASQLKNWAGHLAMAGARRLRHISVAILQERSTQKRYVISQKPAGAQTGDPHLRAGQNNRPMFECDCLRSQQQVPSFSFRSTFVILGSRPLI